MPSSTSGTNQCVYPAAHSLPRHRAPKAPHRRHAAGGCVPRLRVTRYRCIRCVPRRSTFCRAASKEGLSPGQKLAKVSSSGEIKWQRELCRSVQKYLNQRSYIKSEWSLTRNLQGREPGDPSPGMTINVALFRCRPRPAPPLPGGSPRSA